MVNNTLDSSKSRSPKARTNSTVPLVVSPDLCHSLIISYICPCTPDVAEGIVTIFSTFRQMVPTHLPTLVLPVWLGGAIIAENKIQYLFPPECDGKVYLFHRRGLEDIVKYLTYAFIVVVK